MAAMLRHKVPNAIREDLFVVFPEIFYFELIHSCPITGDASEDSSSSNFLPLSQSSTSQKSHDLEFLLKTMVERANATIHLSWLVFHHHICWALAIAYHRYAVYIYIYDIC
jgi:hypothetical protein